MPGYNPYYGPTYTGMGYQQPAIGQASFTPYVQPMQQSYTPAPVQQPKVMEWVEGEIGAKAFQMPAGWPANTPIPLWDSTDTVIYLKSVNQMGMPNPMQKLKYTIEETQQQALMSGASGNSMSGQDMSQFVTKQDLEQLKQEIRNMGNGGNNTNTATNQNGSNSSQNGNRGGNR